jgi:hypothetical protein
LISYRSNYDSINIVKEFVFNNSANEIKIAGLLVIREIEHTG